MARITQVERKFTASTVDAGAIDRAAQPFEQAAKVLGAVAEQKERVEVASAKSEVALKNAKMTRDLDSSFRETQALFAQDPTASMADFEVKVDSQINATVSGMNTDRSRSLMSSSAELIKQKYLSAHDRWEEGQIEKNILTDIDKTANDYAEQSYEAGKSGNLQQYLNIQGMTNDVLVASSEVVGADQLSKISDTTRKDNAVNFMAGMTRNSPSQALSVLNSGKLGEIFTKREIDKLKDNAERKATTLLKADLQLRRDNPMRWLETNGSTPPEIDFADPRSFQDRADYVTRQRELHPAMNIPMLRNEEADALQAILKKSNPQQASETLQSIAINSPEGFMDDIAFQLFNKKPEYGAALSLSQQAPVISRDILRGEQLIASKSVVVPTDSSLMQSEVWADLGNAIGEPTTRRQILTATKSLYTSRMFDAGKSDTKDIDTDILEAALKDVVGDVGEINNAKVVTFRGLNNQVVTADDFEDAFDDMTDEDILKTGQSLPYSGGKQVDMDFVREWGRLVAVQDGKYRVHLVVSGNEIMDNTYLTNEDGSPYVLDFKEVYNRGEIVDKTLLGNIAEKLSFPRGR